MGRTRVRAHWRRKRGGMTAGELLVLFILILAVLAAFNRA